MSGCRLASWRLDLSRARTSHAVSAWLSSQHSRSWPNRRETIWKVSRTRRAHIVPVSNAGALPVLGRQPLFELNSDSRPTLTKSDSEQSDVDGWGFHKSFDGSFGSTPSSVHRAATESREIVFQARSVFSFARERERERRHAQCGVHERERLESGGAMARLARLLRARLVCDRSRQEGGADARDARVRLGGLVGLPGALAQDCRNSTRAAHARTQKVRGNVGAKLHGFASRL